MGCSLQAPELRNGGGGEQKTFFGCDLGRLASGICANLVLFALNTLVFAGGAVHNPQGALLPCASPQAACTVVNGRVSVRQGQLTALELAPLIAQHNRLALRLARNSLQG